jgi:hypothetical protein
MKKPARRVKRRQPETVSFRVTREVRRYAARSKETPARWMQSAIEAKLGRYRAAGPSDD